MPNPTREEWQQLAQAALTAAVQALRAAANEPPSAQRLHSTADYLEAILDQAPPPH
jgi:hypothetical protein